VKPERVYRIAAAWQRSMPLNTAARHARLCYGVKLQDTTPSGLNTLVSHRL